MKKISLIIVFCTLLLITGCGRSANEIEFVNDNGYDFPEEGTYQFTGVSEHFAFKTGKVYYGDDNQKLLIKNFEIINEINNQDEIEEYLVNVSFSGTSLFSDQKKSVKDNDFKRAIESTKIEESGVPSSKSSVESDAFLETRKNEFKSSIKIEITYCYKSNDCKVEDLNINYIK